MKHFTDIQKKTLTDQAEAVREVVDLFVDIGFTREEAVSLVGSIFAGSARA